MRENAGKMRTRITPNMDTFYAVNVLNKIRNLEKVSRQHCKFLLRFRATLKEYNEKLSCLISIQLVFIFDLEISTGCNTIARNLQT